MDVFQQTFLPVYRGRVSRIQHIEYRLVVFVYQHHAPPAVPLVRLLQHVGKPLAYVLKFCSSPVFLFPCADRTSYDIIQFARSCKVRSVKVDMKHGVFRPLRLQPVNGKSLEQFFPPLEIAFQGRDQQALAEPTRAANSISG